MQIKNIREFLNSLSLFIEFIEQEIIIIVIANKFNEFTNDLIN